MSPTTSSPDAQLSEFVAALAKLPLIDQPGASWDYSHSTDVVGRIIEIVSGQTLGAFLHERIFTPLGMSDTGFSVRADEHERLAEPFANDPDSGATVKLFDPRTTPSFEMGGGGLSRRWTITRGSRRCSISAARSAARASSDARRWSS